MVVDDHSFLRWTLTGQPVLGEDTNSHLFIFLPHIFLFSTDLELNRTVSVMDMKLLWGNLFARTFFGFSKIRKKHK